LFAVIAVSSDDDAILEVGRLAGADLLVKRPAELATDAAPKPPGIYHCAMAAQAHLGREGNIFVDLQPTSPLRLTRDIIGAVELQEQTGAQSVITGQIAKCSPYFGLVELKYDGTVDLAKHPLVPFVRRQDAPRCYDMNGSVYVWPQTVMTPALSVFYPSTRLYEMPEERSVDIDTELDFLLAELLLKHRLSGAKGFADHA
jgi:N-acylneuraminate cytidylyltransferase/CMP-N,N'-diacetyllegionaminic acid synthase